MKVCVSLNGVLADTPEAMVDLIARDVWIRVPKEYFGKGLVGASFPSITHGGRMKRLTRRVYESVKDILFDTDEFLKTPPVKGAVEAIQQLVAAGCEIRIVSDAKSVTRSRITRWLEENGFPGGMSVTLTRKGRRPKEPHQCACEIVIDRDIERLAGIAGRDGLQLIHFMPEEDTAGANVVPQSFVEDIVSLRGWNEVLSMVLEHEQCAQAA
jgi:hypothetical protein